MNAEEARRHVARVSFRQAQQYLTLALRLDPTLAVEKGGTKYPGEPVDLALARQALNAAGTWSTDPPLDLVPTRLIAMVDDLLTELSWRRDKMSDGRMVK